MLLAAGLGLRMRPLTLEMPKPLVAVAGQALIDRAMAALEKTSISRVVVNLHHLGAQLRTHLEEQRNHRPFQFIFSDESDQLLDSGGGVVKALPFLRQKPFFILNTDTFWQEKESNLERLAAAFDPDKMDMLLLTVRREQAALPERGDFLVTDSFHGKAGRLHRAAADDPHAVTYSGALIVHPAIFAGAAAVPHSLNVYFDRAIATGRLYGLPLEGCWYTVGTMAALAAVSALLSSVE